MMRGLSLGAVAARQRHTKDIFHGDPFKIQSYNFRYAERPAYPVQQYPRPEPQPLHARPQFETYYYNHRFKTNPIESQPITTTPLTSASAFTEHRRRKFLHDFKCIPTPPRKIVAPIINSARSASVAPQPRRMLGTNTPLTVTNSPLLQSCCHRGEYQMTRRGYQSTTSLVKSSSTNVLRTGAGATRSASTVNLQRNRSAHSGCEININISGRDSDSEMDNNVRIKIETDSVSLRNNTDRVEKSTMASTRSISNFGIDKRLSKFNVGQKTNCNQERNERISYSQLKQQEEQREYQQQRERAVQRERQRELLRELERERDRDRLLQLEAERERDRLRLLERETQRELEFERINRYKEQQRREAELRLPMRAVAMPSPVTMTSHLYRRESDDRLPGMMPFRELAPTKRAQRLRNLTRTSVAKSTYGLKTSTDACNSEPASVPPPPTAVSALAHSPTFPAATTFSHNLERCSSGTSNGNVHVLIATAASNHSLRRRLSAVRLNEHKPLNSALPNSTSSQNLPIHTRLNNMPIRITTTRSADKDPQIAINKVRLRDLSPMPEHRSSNSRLDYNVNINVYADHLRMMRL
ncbi:serine/threonine-protein kinase prpf4B [Drosophila willistoni]|uniref:serine/threonine-protein kinase prpf4B n=1 Tax=Drosophila willistoni TaxID=7260 RepID=UPI000C26D6C6|nr:serine/threonine-protein kinase prpf4B [Drosophila willistoni]